MANTYVQIGSTVTVGSGGAANIDFSLIPSTYTDLVLKLSLRGSDANNYVNSRISFNGSTSGYTCKMVYGLGSGTPSSLNNSVTNAVDFSSYGTGSSATASTFGSVDVYIPNYAGSQNKSLSVDQVSENNATTAIAALTAGLWSNSAAINQITITPAVGTYVQYSTATLYGLSKS
jgi:hypothetical protein